jgi:uncharacterized membrane protein
LNDEERLNSLEKRIAELEKEVNQLKQNRPHHGGNPLVHSPHVGKEVSPSVFQYDDTKKEALPETVQKQATDWEHLIARVWLPRVFMFVLLIGLIWGFKAAVDGGWITEPMRCLLGLLAGGAFIYLGRRQYQQQRPLLSQVLFGGSIGIFMLTTFAAHYLYDFINVPTTFLFNLLWTLLGLWFSHQYKSQALGVLASIAGILTPFLVDSSNPSTGFFVAYEVLLYTSFMIFALKQRFAALFYVSFILMHPAFMIVDLGSASSEGWLAYGILVQHLLLLGSIWMKSGMLNHQLRVLGTSFVFTALWFKLSLDSSDIDMILLMFTLLYSAISTYCWRKQWEQALPYMLAIASYALLFFMMNRFESDAVVGFFILEGFVALALGFVIRSAFQKINGLLIYLLGCIAGLEILSDGMISLASVNMFIWIVLLLTLAGITLLIRRYPLGNQANVMTTLLYYGIGVLFLFFITDVTVAVTQNVSDNAQRLLISSTWVAYAIAVIAYGLNKGIKQARLAGIALLFLTLIKVIFFDLPTVSVVIKAVLFIGLGGIGVLLSRFFYKKE